MRDDRVDRQIILDDLKKRLIDLTENTPELPGVAWDAEPVRYFKLNQEWCKLLAGWLDHMESEAWWPEAEGQDYPGIQGILKFEEGIELPEVDFDCEDVEDCLETSETIANLTTLINELEEQINELEDQIDELEDAAPIDDITLPPNPDFSTGANDLCKSAAFVSTMLRDVLVEAWTDAKTLDAFEFISAFLGVVWWDYTRAVEFWQYAQTIATPTLGEDAAEYVENIQTAFFCAELNLEDASQLIQDDPDIPDLEKSLWLSILDNYKQSQINEWAALGKLQTLDVDCTEGCPWKVVYDFKGDYVPVGDETAIYTGDTWDVEDGDFIAGEGYDSSAVTMVISHSLPEQCRVLFYQMTVAKPVNCGRLDVAVWYRGPDGEGVEQWSGEQFTINNVLSPMGFNLGEGAVLSTAKVGMTAVICGPGDDGSKIGRVVLIGSGARPGE